MTKQKQLRLRVMAEYASSGIWVMEAVGPFRHGMIKHASLKLPESLSRRFDDWIKWYYDILGFDGAVFDVDAFNAEGLRLATDLKIFLGSDVYVELIPEAKAGELGEAQEITLSN
jgi:hypothetical protein